MPIVRGRQDPLLQDALRAVLARLPLVPDDRHLGLEILRGDERVHHAVRFEIERPLEVLVGGGKRLEVVRAVEPRRAVGKRAVLVQFLRDVRVVRGPLEHQVFEEMGHARLAVSLVPGADEVGDVHRDALVALVWEEQEAQTVVEPVLGDPLDARDFRHAVGKLGLRSAGGGERRQRSDDCAECLHPFHLRLHLNAELPGRTRSPPCYMLSIMACPNSLHPSSVAPSISRSKS